MLENIALIEDEAVRLVEAELQGPSREEVEAISDAAEPGRPLLLRPAKRCALQVAQHELWNLQRVLAREQVRQPRPGWRLVGVEGLCLIVEP